MATSAAGISRLSHAAAPMLGKLLGRKGQPRGGEELAERGGSDAVGEAALGVPSGRTTDNIVDDDSSSVASSVGASEEPDEGAEEAMRAALAK